MCKYITERTPHFLEMIMEIVRSSRSAVTLAISLLSAPSTFINSSMAKSCSMQEICCSGSVLRYSICTRTFPRRRRRSVKTSISSSTLDNDFCARSYFALLIVFAINICFLRLIYDSVSANSFFRILYGITVLSVHTGQLKKDRFVFL